MDKAKAAVSDFLGRSGHHDTSVHETVAPAVQHETVKSHQHENVTTAVDREVHQDHHHRTVQPVHDREVLPEKHSHQVAGVEHRKFDHRDHDTTKHHLAQEAAQFKDHRQVEGTTTSQAVAPTVGGEHVHHHIHETIQPVIHKETVQPSVVHTTVPVHEVHHHKAVHHDSTSLPAMTMDQFKSKGGVLEGREDRFDHFQGAPKGLESGATGGLGSVRGSESTSERHGGLTDNTTTSTGTHGTTGTHGVTGTQGATGTHGVSGSHGLTGTHGTTGTHGASEAATTGALAAERQHHHADRGVAGQGNLTGSSTQGGVVSSNTRQDNNLASSREDHLSSTGRGTGTGHAKGVVEGIAGHDKNELTHREQEDGHLPKALTEDKSKFVPHSETRQGNEQI